MPSGQYLPSAWLTESLYDDALGEEWYQRSLEIADNASLQYPLFKESIHQFHERQRTNGNLQRGPQAVMDYWEWASSPAILPEWLPRDEAEWVRQKMPRKSATPTRSSIATDTVTDEAHRSQTSTPGSQNPMASGKRQGKRPVDVVSQLQAHMTTPNALATPTHSALGPQAPAGSANLKKRKSVTFAPLPDEDVVMADAVPVPSVAGASGGQTITSSFGKNPKITVLPQVKKDRKLLPFEEDEATVYARFPGLKQVTEVQLKKSRPEWLPAEQWCTRHPSNGQIVPADWIFNPPENDQDLGTYYHRGRNFEDNDRLKRPLLGESLVQYQTRRRYALPADALYRQYRNWAMSKATDERWVPRASRMIMPGEGSGTSGPSRAVDKLTPGSSKPTSSKAEQSGDAGSSVLGRQPVESTTTHEHGSTTAVSSSRTEAAAGLLKAMSGELVPLPQPVSTGMPAYPGAHGRVDWPLVTLTKPRPSWARPEWPFLLHPSNGQVIPRPWAYLLPQSAEQLATHYQRGLTIEDNAKLTGPLLGESLLQYKRRRRPQTAEEIFAVEYQYGEWMNNPQTDFRWLPSIWTALKEYVEARVPPHEWPIYRLTKPSPAWLPKDAPCAICRLNQQVVPFAWLTLNDQPLDLARVGEQGRELESNFRLMQPLLGESMEAYLRRMSELRDILAHVGGERDAVPGEEELKRIAGEFYQQLEANPRARKWLPFAT